MTLMWFMKQIQSMDEGGAEWKKQKEEEELAENERMKETIAKKAAEVYEEKLAEEVEKREKRK